MDWEKYFEFLIDWKKLPAYRLEPRIDSFIGYYLQDMIPDIVSKYKKEILPSVEVGVIEVIEVIPEFPIRQKTIDPIKHEKSGERSNKVDFLLITKEEPNFLVEVKSDSKSRRPEQDEDLKKAREIGLDGLLNGIKHILEKTDEQDKYLHLISKLKKFSGINKRIEILYIQPSNKEKCTGIIDYNKIVEWFNSREKKHKSENTNELFEVYFKNALSEWAND
jgi:hypothetical protein